MPPSPPGTSKAGHPMAYLTDVEGQWDKLVSFCQDNPLVHLDSQGRLRVRPGATFIFGGDAIDRGPHGRQGVATLLEARRRQPSQVVLLAGNRDINKLRLVRELRGHPLPRTPAEVREGPRPALLRWIFEHTMGARDAFHFRQQELERTAGPVSGEDVVASFLEDLGPGGALREYLTCCQLVHRVGNTLLVHGGVHEHSLEVVPGLGRVEGVDAWAESLNRWYAEQLEAFAEGRLTAEGTPAWEPLIAYQAPLPGKRVNTGSVVYGRMADEHNHHRCLAPASGTSRALMNLSLLKSAKLELRLYDFIEGRQGMKRLMSTHLNTVTGRVKVFGRDSLGRISPSEAEPVDEFTLEGLDDLKNKYAPRRGGK